MKSLKCAIACYDRPCSNGYFISEKSWDNIFNSKSFKESVKSKTIFGVIDQDNEVAEIDINKAAIVMSKIPVKDKYNSCYVATFEILDTENGRQVSELIKQGKDLSVGFRGAGNIEYKNGIEIVEDFELYGFDVIDK